MKELVYHRLLMPALERYADKVGFIDGAYRGTYAEHGDRVFRLCDALKNTLGIEPGACVAIEDSVNGVLSAIAAGMQCIVVPAPEVADDPRLQVAHGRLDSLEQLPEALQHWESEAST